MSKKKDTSRESLREQIMGKREDSEFDVNKREIHIMTRLSTNIVEAIDAMVTLNVFKSRSEAVAAYVENAMFNNADLYETLIKQAQEVLKMRNSATDSILQTLEEKK